MGFELKLKASHLLVEVMRHIIFLKVKDEPYKCIDIENKFAKFNPKVIWDFLFLRITCTSVHF